MPVCRTKGRFVRCAGAKAPKRRHRKLRSDWSGCGCPEGAREVVNRKATSRGWACVKDTERGPRFVSAVCDVRDVRSGEG